MKKKVLVTGAAGYIGQHLSKMLSASYDVYGLDIKTPTDMKPFKAFVNWDLRIYPDDTTFLFEDMPTKYDAVVHLAALVRVNESVKKPIEYYDTNINGTIHLLKGIEFDNFILASTGAAAKPTSPYATSKIVAEQCVRQHCILSDISYTIFRFYNVIGSAGYAPTNPDGLFYNLIKAKETGEFNLYGDDYDTKDGTAIRDYVHVMEICNAIKLAIGRPANKAGTEYGSIVENLGHGEGHSVKEIVETFQKVNNCNFKVNYCQRREGDLEYSVLDNVSPYMKELYFFEELLLA
jgi:UDP-glucose 4-epimerase